MNIFFVAGFQNFTFKIIILSLFEYCCLHVTKSFRCFISSRNTLSHIFYISTFHSCTKFIVDCTIRSNRRGQMNMCEINKSCDSEAYN